MKRMMMGVVVVAGMAVAMWWWWPEAKPGASHPEAAGLGLMEAEPVAVAAATGGGGLAWRLTGVNVLGQLGGAQGRAVLTALAGEHNTNKLVRAAAAKALQNQQGKAAE